MSSQATTLPELFDRYFSDQKGDASDQMLIDMVYPDFKVRVLVYPDTSPRDPFFEFWKDIGMGLLDKVFAGEALRTTKPTFVFPERWLTLNETRCFMDALAKHPDARAKRIEQINIITNSPIMLTDFPASLIRVIQQNRDADAMKMRTGARASLFGGNMQIS